MTSGQLDARAKGLALALLAVTQFVIILDASIVNVALPSIGAALDFSQDDLSWVVNAYTLTFGGFLLLGGRLADLMGRRRMFMSGLVLFTAASLLGGLAQSDVWLIAARAAQGLGAALVSPAALSLVTTIFSEGAERNRALGVWGAVAGSGGAAGVLLGGMLTEWAGWEWVLFVNVPIGLAAVALAPRLLPESRELGAARTFDATGAVLVTGGLALLVYTLVDAESAGWTSTQTLGLGALSLATLAAFVAWEARASDPLMPFSIFRLQTLRGANAVGLLLGMALYSMFFFLSLYLQQVLGYSALETGFAFLPLAVLIIVSSTVASQLVTRTGTRPTLVVGMLLITGALVWFSQISAGGSHVGDVLFPALVVAVGLGFAFVPVTIAAVTGTRPQRGGARVRPHQHEPADRRRARVGDPGLGRHQPNGERGIGRHRRPGGGAERGFPDGVSRRRRVRARGRDRGRPDDQFARLPAAARGRACGRPGPLCRTATDSAGGGCRARGSPNNSGNNQQTRRCRPRLTLTRRKLASAPCSRSTTAHGRAEQAE
jgi:EmrB/QacA subfamily drug resistance transporter